jgi:hypothetical protein
LRHFRDNNFQQRACEYSDNLRTPFDDAEECERAEAELAARNLIELASAAPAHLPIKDRVRAAALTPDGERFIKKFDLG